MKIGDRFMGRDREAAQLELSIGPGTDGLRLMMLTGPSGLGKTTLTGVVCERAAARGFQVTVANGRAGSLSTPFAPWIEALPQLQQSMPSSAGDGGSADMDRIGAELVALLAELCVDQPLLLVFDDAQALDESSIALLRYAAGVSERMNLTLMFVEQSDAVDVSSSYRACIDGLLARRVVQHLELGPMSDASISELVRKVLALRDDQDVPSEIVLRALGNPWFAIELAGSYERGESEIPVSIAAAATARLHRLDEFEQDVAYATALCPEGAYIGWLEALVDQRPRAFARTMERIKDSGLLREDGELVSIAHPLMRQSLLDEMSAAMKRALHQELAEVIAETPSNEVTAARAQGYHLSMAGRPSDAVSHYLRAAEANEILGQLHEAFFDYVRALESEPRVDHRVELLKRCAFAATQIASERATDYWGELARVAAAKNDNETYAYALFQQYWTSYDGTAMDRLERAAALGPDKYGWSARAAACLCTMAADYVAAIEHDKRALELAREAGDGVLETLALEKLGLAYASSGRLPEAIESLSGAVALATRQRLHSWALVAWGALAETLAENLQTDRALQESRAALKYVDDLSLDRHRPLALAWLARALNRRGDVTEAMRMADEAALLDGRFADDRHSALVLALRLQIAVDSGNLAVGMAAAEAALEAVRHHGYVSWTFEINLEYGRLLSRTSNIDEAIVIARELSIDEPVPTGTLAIWLVRAALWYGRDDARELAQATIGGLVANSVPLAALMAAEVDASLGKDDAGKVERLCEVADRWNTHGRGLDALRALTSMGIIQVRIGKLQEAIATFNTARAGFVKCGADADADFVASQLRALGTRSRAKSRSTNVGNLTKRELEIARLVASGMRNAEVAGQLFLAEKTVAAHLSNIYGKLEVRSRVQLAAWLKEHDPGLASSVA